MAIVYVTTGALVEAWSLIWYRWLATHPPEHDWVWYVCYGFILTGLIIFFIGMSLGWIGRAARKAELPPSEVTGAVAQAEKNMAARAPVAAANPAAAAYMPGGQAIVPGAAVPGAVPPGTPAMPGVVGQPVIQVRPS
jgi:hypothetical protein